MTTPDATAPIRAHTVFDHRYRVVEQLARGGMGTVWRAHDERLSRPVAVKVLHASVSEAGREQLAVEARVLAQLAHPHIAAVYDVGTADGADYLVMELIDGRAVGSVLAERGHLSWPEATLVCAQVADALASAHARGVVHRDVTAGNVMLTPSGVKLVDFGLSTNAGAPEADGDGNLMGTPAYVAPERLDGHAVAAGCDVYALGVLLYRCLSGQLPWPVTSAEQLLAAHQGGQPEPLPAIAGLPEPVRDVCRRCLARDPGDRPTAAQVAQVLQAAAADSVAADSAPVATGGDATDPLPVTQFLAAPVPATAAVRPAPGRAPDRRGRRPAVAVVAGAAVLLSATLAWSSPSRMGSAQTRPLALAGATTVTGCAVTYRQLEDDGKHFTALISVSQFGQPTVDDWRLDFQLPGGQRADAAARDWSQTGDTVTSLVAAARPLPPGRPATLRFAGVHDGTNPLPTVFHLATSTQPDALPCAATILGSQSTRDTEASRGESSTEDSHDDGRGKGRKGKSRRG